MGQQKGNPTPSYQNQAYEALRPNTNARENRDYGTNPVMIDDNTTLTSVIDATFAKDTRIYSGTDATIAVAASNAGTTYIATKSSATQTFTLPAASTAGLEYTFICGNVGGEIKILGVAGDTINCKTAAQGTSLSVAADTGVKNTAATNVLGDTITLVSDGTTNWWMHAQSGIFASN
jgi:hypothetical protein